MLLRELPDHYCPPTVSWEIFGAYLRERVRQGRPQAKRSGDYMFVCRR